VGHEGLNFDNSTSATLLESFKKHFLKNHLKLPSFFIFIVKLKKETHINLEQINK